MKLSYMKPVGLDDLSSEEIVPGLPCSVLGSGKKGSIASVDHENRKVMVRFLDGSVGFFASSNAVNPNLVSDAGERLYVGG